MTGPDDVTAAPPEGEEVHMPAPSILPLINAAALALAIVAITLSWWIVGAAMIVFLASKQARQISGQTILVDGGATSGV